MDRILSDILHLLSKLMKFRVEKCMEIMGHSMEALKIFNIEAVVTNCFHN